MRVRNCKAILNPYEWLPPYGESDVSLVLAGGQARLAVEYDSPADAAAGMKKRRRMRREIVFRDVRYLHTASFPGATLLNIRYIRYECEA